MFDIGGIELLVIAAVAIIVVGPKELPALMRGVGRFVAKAQNLAREFRANFEEMARESEMEEVRRNIESLQSDVMKPHAGQTQAPPAADKAVGAAQDDETRHG